MTLKVTADGVQVLKPYLEQRYDSDGFPKPDPNSKRQQRIKRRGENENGNAKIEKVLNGIIRQVDMRRHSERKPRIARRYLAL